MGEIKEGENRASKQCELVQFRLTKSEKYRLKLMCAQLGITIQDFIHKLIIGKVGDDVEE